MTEGVSPPQSDRAETGAPEYRRDPVTGQWALLASERSQRPIQSGAEHNTSYGESCPFCEGNEEQTPPETFALRSTGVSNDAGWTVRVVPNRYPAVRGGLRQLDPERERSRMGRACAGHGRHEVVIERPDHHWTISDLSDRHVADVFDVYRQRMRFFRTKRPLRYCAAFKNVGSAAGASQDHVHSQILAVTDIPPRIQDELSGSEAYYRSRGGCVFCDMIQWERSCWNRVIEESPKFLAWCPFASRFPFEAWIAPKEHSARYDDVRQEDLLDLGALVRRLLVRLETMAESVAYNYYIHTAPFAAGSDAHYHWHIEITPRLTGLAGFEVGTGMHINTVPPEEAARRWREI